MFIGLTKGMFGTYKYICIFKIYVDFVHKRCLYNSVMGGHFKAVLYIYAIGNECMKKLG